MWRSLNKQPVTLAVTAFCTLAPSAQRRYRGTASGIATGDVNEAGAMDIAVACSDGPNILYFGSR